MCILVRDSSMGSLCSTPKRIWVELRSLTIELNPSSLEPKFFFADKHLHRENLYYFRIPHELRFDVEYVDRVLAPHYLFEICYVKLIHLRMWFEYLWNITKINWFLYKILLPIAAFSAVCNTVSIGELDISSSSPLLSDVVLPLRLISSLLWNLVSVKNKINSRNTVFLWNQYL